MPSILLLPIAMVVLSSGLMTIAYPVFHRPHPRKETDKGAVKSVRKFLENAGVRP